ncbi:putative ubiquitin-protein ligase [Saccharomycopsis crataegensis]|uniref:Ubiquitin-protein ligase n=1 Tax=Saccharomycopsis crataegensis TaxID=43959 RepID=A0AAV5QUJ3_9ASCO|nr:putative ubiquitin-protein ligase [Saccharomycopsis crataegensis]
MGSGMGNSDASSKTFVEILATSAAFGVKNATINSTVNSTIIIPPFLDTENTYIPSIIVFLINSIIAQFYESEIPERNFNIFFSYLVSRYALVCMFSAIVLNRTVLFASINNNNNNRNLRHNVDGANGIEVNFQGEQAGLMAKLGVKIKNLFIYAEFSKIVKVLLRFLILGLLFINLKKVLISLNCYVKPVNKILSNYEYFNYYPEDAEANSWYFQPVSYNVTRAFEIYNSTVIIGRGGNINHDTINFGKIGPSTNILWPLYLTFCFSQFIETFCSVISGSQPNADTSLTLFEQSLAFHEFDSTSWSPFESPMYPTPELLILCVTSILSHMSIHVLKTFGWMKYRLLVSTILGLSFISYYVASIFTGRILYFPLVVIISFLPQMGVLVIILICCVIYFSAYAIAKTDSNGSHELTFTNLGVENLNINLNEDFNSVVMKLSVIALTTATKKSYIKELSYIELPASTWLDMELHRLEESSSEAGKNRGDAEDSIYKKKFISSYNNFFSVPPELITLLEEETRLQAMDPNNRSTHENWESSRKFHRFGVIMKFFMRLLFALVFKRKSILQKQEALQRKNELLKKSEKSQISSASGYSIEEQSFYEETNDEVSVNYDRLLTGTLVTEEDDTSDFEFEDDNEEDLEPLEYDSDDESEAEATISTETSLITKNRKINKSSQKEVENHGHLISEIFNPSEVLSLFINKPTIKDDSITNINEFTFDEEFKRILSFHLSQEYEASSSRMQQNQEQRPITRSLYKELSNLGMGNSQSQDSETAKLIQLIVAQRKGGLSNHKHKPSRKNDVEEDGDDEDFEDESFSKEYTCVICQTHPRQIILWPCKCLAICDNCRLSLVLRDFNSCVCCRQGIDGYSKVFMP